MNITLFASFTDIRAEKIKTQRRREKKVKNETDIHGIFKYRRMILFFHIKNGI